MSKFSNFKSFINPGINAQFLKHVTIVRIYLSTLLPSEPSTYGRMTIAQKGTDDFKTSMRGDAENIGGFGLWQHI